MTVAFDLFLNTATEIEPVLHQILIECRQKFRGIGLLQRTCIG
jgi:hypothetical protein